MIGFHHSICIFIGPYSSLLVTDPQPPLKDKSGWNRSYWLQWVPLQTCLEILDITGSRLLKVLRTVRDGIRNRRDRNKCKQCGEGPGWPTVSGFRPVLKELAYAEMNMGINHIFISKRVPLERLSQTLIICLTQGSLRWDGADMCNCVAHAKAGVI